VREAARILQVEELLERKPRQLSGGQRQRVAIGRALVRRPGIFLLDEPLSNLDAELRVAMRAELAALRERISGTMIYVTHDQVEAMTLADRIVVLNAGRVEQIGAPLDLFNQPESRFVAGFIGSPRMNFLEAEAGPGDWNAAELKFADGAKLNVEEGMTSGLTGRVTVGFRPQQAVLAATGGLALKVTQVEQLGSETILHCTTTAEETVVVAQYGQRMIAAGAILHLDLERTPLLFFGADGERVGPRGTAGSRRK
ncbi:MAG: ABC transporter ATP-binding protein, partial [Propylenella sp.]